MRVSANGGVLRIVVGYKRSVWFMLLLAEGVVNGLVARFAI
jgi:hypothetical protein